MSLPTHGEELGALGEETLIAMAHGTQRSRGPGYSTGRPRPRAISIRCTSEVPSPISSTLASR